MSSQALPEEKGSPKRLCSFTLVKTSNMMVAAFARILGMLN